MTPFEHTVTITVDGRAVRGFTDYVIDTDMLEPADTFTMTRPFDRGAWDLCRTDRPVRVHIDDAVVLSGFIDTRHKSSAEGTFTVTGRDRAGRMIQESAPLLRYGGLGLRELAEQLAAPWFPRATLSNARNRDLVRGRGGGKAGTRREPPIVSSPTAPRRIEPGQTRWAVLEEFVREAGYLLWSTADGEALVIGLPNYEQEAQYQFFHAAEGSPRASRTNVLELEVAETTADRYSQIIALGVGRGDAVNYGENVRHRGLAEHRGDDFTLPKRLIIVDDGLRSYRDAQARAERELAERDAGRLAISLVVAKHGQVAAAVAGGRSSAARPTLYVFDTMCHIEDEETGVTGLFLITKASYRADRMSGERTLLEVVPKGTRLAL